MIFNKPPDTIWLQYHGDAEPENEPVDADGITWCWEEIFQQDIRYIRADVIEQRILDVIKECAQIAQEHYMKQLSESDFERWNVAGKIKEQLSKCKE